MALGGNTAIIVPVVHVWALAHYQWILSVFQHLMYNVYILSFSVYFYVCIVIVACVREYCAVDCSV